MSPIGFVGTGVIGRPMAERVMAAGHDLVVHDRRRDAATPLEAAGATWAATPAEVAERCRTVLCSLPGPPEADAVVDGPDGLLVAARSGDVIADLTTNSVEVARRLHERAAAVGVHYLDAPVSGGAMGAAAGTLAVMVGGDAGAFARIEPVLSSFGRTVLHLGEPGSGTIAKLVNNQVFLCATLLLEEGIVLAAKAGMEPARLLEVLRAASAAPYTALAPLVLAADHDRGIFSLALAEKDVALALASGRALGVPMPVTAQAHQTYLGAVAAGLGASDFVATIRTIEAAAGVALVPMDAPS